MTADTALGGHLIRGDLTGRNFTLHYRTHQIFTVHSCRKILFRTFAILLSLLLVLVPVIRISRVNATVAIPSIVSSLFLAVALSLGISFDLAGLDITAWAEARIQAYLSSQGYSSVSDWLGAQFQAELTVSGSFLGLTPNLFAKVKAAVEFGISDGSIPSGGTEASPVTQDIKPKYYLNDLTVTNLITNQTDSYTEFPLAYLSDYYSGNGFVNQKLPLNYLPNNYIITISYTAMPRLSSWTNIINCTSNSITNISVTKFYNNNIEIKNRNDDYNYLYSYITAPDSSPYPINTQYPIYFIPTAYDYNGYPYFALIPVYRSTNGQYYLQIRSRAQWSNIPAVMADTNGKIISTGIPQYNFNQADNIYIDLQIGELTSALQALTALLTAINNNLVSWTIAIQSNSPGDLPVDTTNLIDFVYYCNEQTNLYMSGTQTMAETLGNMYLELYNTLGTTQSAQLSNAIINSYNAFINKLTLFEQSTGTTGSQFQSVQQFTSDLLTIQNNAISSGNITSALTSALNSLNTYVGNASSIEEIIGLHNAYQSFLDSLGLNLEQSSYSKNVVIAFNGIVDSYLNGTITQEQALSQLLNSYKTNLSNAKTAEDVSAIIAGYQACIDRISIAAFEVPSDGLGTLVPEVIQQEDDIIQQLNTNELSTMLQFQQWQYINAGEANLYREYFQKILDNTSPFYVFIYPVLILGIVGIILGTHIRIHGKGSVRNATSGKKRG